LNVVQTHPHPRPAGAARIVPTPAETGRAWKIAWPWLFWALWGGWLAVSDLHDEHHLQPALLRLLIGAALLGLARPRRWWLWSLALAAWVPLEPALAVLMRLAPGYEFDPGSWLLPPLPALLGGFLGRSIARGVRPPATPDANK
jgi:hypothetical protein